MPTHRIPRALLQQTVNLYAQHGNNSAAAARASGISVTTFKHRLSVAQQDKVMPAATKERDPKLLEAEIKRLGKDLAAAVEARDEARLTSERVRTEIIGLKQAPLVVPDWLAKLPTQHTSPGVPTLFASDWHWDEVVKPSQIGGVNEYNRAIAHERAKALIETSIYLLKIISPKMDYPGIVFALGGDMISGNIHDELVATNQFNTMPTILDILTILIWMIRELLKHFPRVFVPCVTGNHGRNTHKMWTKDRHATSFDWLIYNLLAREFAGDERVVFLIPDGPDAYYRVYDHRFLLTHGDQFRGGDGMIGALGPITRGDHKKRSRNAQIDMEYDTMMIGHWHQYIHLTRLIVNGSLKGYDEYAYSNNFGYEEPQQALFINHPKYGITFRMPVKVERKRETSKAAWVSFK